MIITSNGPELVRLAIIDEKCEILYDSWFEPRG
jgi:hypothetical protein